MSEIDLQVVILAAGLGKRFGGELPKALVPLAGKPLIGYLVETVARLGSSYKPVIVVGHKAEQVKAYLGRGYEYVLQEALLGTGYAVAICKDAIFAKDFLVLYADAPLVKSESLLKLYQTHLENRAVMSMATVKLPDFEDFRKPLQDFGRIIRDQDGQFLSIKETKDATPTEREILEVNPGMYIFQREWLFGHIQLLENHNVQGEYYLTDMVAIAKTGGFVVPTVDFSAEEVLGINTPEQLGIAERVIMN
jgi:bifunctional UDP-N-acetylglucosamine pyrophosphorylase/glucosamine-1-phosphate N-acetyltransferase